jgi:hypothetical protein
MQGKALKEIHTILTEILGEHAPWYAFVKNWVAQFNVVIFPPVMRLVLDDKYCDQPGEYWSNSRTKLGRPPNFGGLPVFITLNLNTGVWKEVFHPFHKKKILPTFL